MTLIVGYVDEFGNGHMASDSNGVDVTYHSKQERASSKIFKNGPFLIGYTSSFRMGQILEYCFEPPVVSDKTISNLAYMVKHFIPEVIRIFKEHNYMLDSEKSGGEFLVYYNGSLFSIFSDFQVAEGINMFNACGSGCFQAVTAFDMLNKMDAFDSSNIKKHLTDVIEVVSETNITVGGRIDYLTMSPTLHYIDPIGG